MGWIFCLFQFCTGFVYTSRSGGGDGQRKIDVAATAVVTKRPSGIFMCLVLDVFQSLQFWIFMDIVLKEGFGMY